MLVIVFAEQLKFIFLMAGTPFAGKIPSRLGYPPCSSAWDQVAATQYTHRGISITLNDVYV